MIWLIIFLSSVLANVLLLILLPAGNIKDVVLIVISLIIGALGFSFKDAIANFKIKKKIQKRYGETCSKFNKYFYSTLSLDEKPPKDLAEEQSESDLLAKAIENKVTSLDGVSLNSIKLCYFCLKWKETKSPEDYESIKRLADALGIKYGQINDSIKQFVKIYDCLMLSKKPLNQVSTNELDYEKLLNLFVKDYYKDLQFFEIKEKFLQNKNLHETLIEIIKNGKLSTYGITQETIKRLQKQLSVKSKTSNTFLIFTNNTNADDRANLKNYLQRFGRLGMRGITTQMPVNAWLGVYVIKTETNMTPSGILKEIKSSVMMSSEAIIRIIPINFLESETYTLPFNQSFSNENLKKCYEAIEWFKLGYDYSDSALWSEITGSNITPDELLSVIPFNIFCKGILPSEREFIIKNYDSIKTDLSVTTLTDWKDKDSSLITSTILKYGKPNYSTEELTSILKTNLEDSEKDSKIEKRVLSIAKQIVKGAKDFDKSLKPQNID